MTRPTKDKTTTRRRFLKVAAAGAAASVAAPVSSLAPSGYQVSLAFVTP